MPSGKYLMEDFYYAGGLPVVLRELGEAGCLHKDALTVNGKPIWENVKDAECYNPNVIFPFVETVQAGVRDRGAARKPGAERRRHQTFGGHACLAHPSRTRGCV